MLGAGHNDFADVGLLVRALLLDPGLPPPVVEQMLAQLGVGDISAQRALAIEHAYVRAFFGAALSRESSALLAGPSANFPEVIVSAR